MCDYKHVAIVKLLENYNKKNYGFALYDSEYDLIKDKSDYAQILAVVNPQRKTNRVLGSIEAIISVEEYGTNVSAEVVGIVDICNYITREAERKVKEENKKKRTVIQKEIQAEINKYNTIQYLEYLTQQHLENERLNELVTQYKELGE